MTAPSTLSLRTKLIGMLLIMVLLTLIVVAGIAAYNDIRMFRRDTVRNLTVLANTIGATSRAALVFRDADAGQRILNALEAEPQVDFAGLYNTQGQRLVSYSRKTQEEFQDPPDLDHPLQVTENTIEIIRDIHLENRIVGRIFLKANTGALTARIQTYIYLGLGTMGLTLALAFFLSLFLQRFISKPILDLAETAYQVHAKPDYSLRASYSGGDEIGKLVQGFNEMLAAIQQRDQKLEAYRTRLEDRVQERTRELEATQKELLEKERLAAIGTMAAMVSHEIRNPLGAMRNALFALREFGDITRPELRNNIELIERNILRCDGIVEGLLDFTSPHRHNLEWKTFDPWLEDLLEEQNFPNTVNFVSYLNAPVSVKFEPERFRRALLNVILNGLQATEEKSRQLPPAEAEGYQPMLEIQTAIEENRVKIFIRDNGTGIPEDLIDKIFEPLFSAKSYGAGLGLTIVRGILKDHDGDLAVQSQPGQGTTVTLWFPLFAREG